MLALFRAALDRDLSAVHVHLPVANLVEPSPCQKSFTRWRIGGNLEVVLFGDRAATKHRFDDAESLALVVGKRQLAGSSAMGGTTFQFQIIFLARRVVGNRMEGVILISLAREVGAAGG